MKTQSWGRNHGVKKLFGAVCIYLLLVAPKWANTLVSGLLLALSVAYSTFRRGFSSVPQKYDVMYDVQISRVVQSSPLPPKHRS